jgi:hypothetical protein
MSAIDLTASVCTAVLVRSTITPPGPAARLLGNLVGSRTHGEDGEGSTDHARGAQAKITQTMSFIDWTFFLSWSMYMTMDAHLVALVSNCPSLLVSKLSIIASTACGSSGMSLGYGKTPLAMEKPPSIPFWVNCIPWPAVAVPTACNFVVNWLTWAMA